MVSEHICTGDTVHSLHTPSYTLCIYNLEALCLSREHSHNTHYTWLHWLWLFIYLSLHLFPVQHSAYLLHSLLSSFGFLLSFIILLWLFGGSRGRCGWGSSVWSRFGRLGKQVRPLSERRLRKGACWVSWAPDWGPSLSGRTWAQQGTSFNGNFDKYWRDTFTRRVPHGFIWVGAGASVTDISHRINNSSIKMGRQQEDSLVTD